MVEPITTHLIGKWILTHLGIHGASAATATAVGTAAAITAIGALVYISYLTINVLVNWFQSHTSIAIKPENVAASYQTELKSGERVYVQGIFGKNTGSLVQGKGRTIQYNSLQPEVRKLHSDDKIVIWQ